MLNGNKTLVGLAIAAALGVVSSPASAAALPFKIDPKVLASGSGAVFTGTDINGVSDALVQQVAPTTQLERGWVILQGFVNQSLPVSPFTTRLAASSGAPNDPSVYNLYITFQAIVDGLSGFGAGQSGTIAPGNFTFTLWADPGADDTFVQASTSASGGTASSVVDNGGDDFAVAIGYNLNGSAGFTAATGAPVFSATSRFIVCNGTPGQGDLGGVTVAAAPCGNFDGSSYFIDPIPFYSINFASSVPAQAGNITPFPGMPGSLNAGAAPNAVIQGIVLTTNFVPEPTSVALLGLGLAALGGLRRRAK